MVHARGDGFERGIHIGKELADLIQASVAFYNRYLDRRGISSHQLQDLLTPYLVAGETAYPGSLAVLKGMSTGAMVPIMELFAINAFEELEPLLESPEGELLFLQRKEGYVRPPVGGAMLQHLGAPAGHHPGGPQRALAGGRRGQRSRYRRHARRRTRAGGLAYGRVLPAGRRAERTRLRAGHRIAHGADDGVGVPRVLVSRSSLEARNRADAIARAAMPGRAGGYGHVYAFADDAFTVETTGRQHAVLDEPGPHTNHYLDPGLAELAPPPSDGSRARLKRLRELLAERDPSPRRT